MGVAVAVAVAAAVILSFLVTSTAVVEDMIFVVSFTVGVGVSSCIPMYSSMEQLGGQCMNVSSKLYSRIFMNYDLFTQRRCTVYCIQPASNIEYRGCLFWVGMIFSMLLSWFVCRWGCGDILQPILEKRYR